jgi:hypothetical protein
MTVAGVLKLAKKGEPHAGKMVCNVCGHLPGEHIAGCKCRRPL